MNLIELNRALRQLRLGGIASVLEMRLHQAQVESMAPIDLISCLVSDELTRRGDRLLERRRKQAQFRDPQKTLDNFDFTFNPKMNRSLIFDLATAAFIARHEDSLFVGPPGSGKSQRLDVLFAGTVDRGFGEFLEQLRGVVGWFGKRCEHRLELFANAIDSPRNMKSAAPQNCLHALLGLSILQVSYHRKGMAATRRALHSPGENLQGLLLADAGRDRLDEGSIDSHHHLHCRLGWYLRMLDFTAQLPIP
jgi:hypothetical protein